MSAATLKSIRLECYLPRLWRFSVAADINSNIFDFYFLIWSLSRLMFYVGSGFNVATILVGFPSVHVGERIVPCRILQS
jgi:hypothetical protein